MESRRNGPQLSSRHDDDDESRFENYYFVQQRDFLFIDYFRSKMSRNDIGLMKMHFFFISAAYIFGTFTAEVHLPKFKESYVRAHQIRVPP